MGRACYKRILTVKDISVLGDREPWHLCARKLGMVHKRWSGFLNVNHKT